MGRLLRRRIFQINSDIERVIRGCHRVSCDSPDIVYTIRAIRVQGGCPRPCQEADSFKLRLCLPNRVVMQDELKS